MTATPTSTPTNAPARRGWRVVDIVVAAVLGVATGLIFVVWNNVGYAWNLAMDAITPGFGGIAVGIWLLGGVLGGLIIGKPGAALFVEVLAAVVSMLLGSQWAIETVYSGIAQGLGAELIFLLVGYRRATPVIAMLAGAAAGAFAWLLELFLSGNLAKGGTFLVIYLVTVVISGAVLGGLVGWFLTKALAATGALSRFRVGRDARTTS